MENIKLPTPGEILKEEFMIPNHISAYYLANSIGVPISRIQDILHNRRAVTMDTSIRLGKFFGLSNTYFVNIQNEIDLRKALLENKNEIDNIKPYKLGCSTN